MSPTPPVPQLPQLVQDPLFVLCFIWLLTALGVRVLRHLRLPTLSPSLSQTEHGVLAVALGVGAIQYLPFVLGSFGWLSGRALVISLAVLALLLVSDLRRTLVAGVAAARRWEPLRKSAATLTWLGILLTFLTVLLLRSWLVSPAGDDDGYHMTAPRIWLELGSLAYLPTYTHTNAPMGFEMLYTIALGVWDAAAAKLLHFAAGALSLVGIYAISKRIHGGLAGLIAISLLMVPSPVNFYSGVFSYALSDLGVSVMLCASLLAWTLWLRQPGTLRFLELSALFAGFAASFKFTVLALGAIMTLALLLQGRRQALPLSKTLGLCLRYVAIATLPVLPWLYRNWSTTGNPVFPMLSSVFKTRDWDAEQARVFGRFFRYYNWGVGHGSSFTEKQRLLVLVATAAVAILILAVAFWYSKQPDLRDLVLLCAALLLTAIAVTGLYVRFWFPAIICGCLYLGVIIATAAARFRFGEWIAPAVLLASVPMGRHLYNDAMLPTALRVGLGLTTLDEAYKDDALWQMYGDITRTTPKDAHFLLASFFTTFGMSSGGAFWLDRTCYVTDSHLQHSIDLNSWPAFLDSVERAGISYVVVSDQQFSPHRHGFTFAAAEHEFAYSRRLVADYGQQQIKHGHLELYRLQLPHAR